MSTDDDKKIQDAKKELSDILDILQKGSKSTATEFEIRIRNAEKTIRESATKKAQEYEKDLKTLQEQKLKIDNGLREIKDKQDLVMAEIYNLKVYLEIRIGHIDDIIRDPSNFSKVEATMGKPASFARGARPNLPSKVVAGQQASVLEEPPEESK